jgi:7-cyano-7-deazaguanine reductase
MPKAEGLVCDFLPEEKIQTEVLEAFDYNGEKEIVTIDTSEFSAVCPFSGLPDIARVIIKYIPNCSCIELKSLKYYFVSFRNVGIYQEAVTSRIYKDLKNLLKTDQIFVKTVYNTRGGMNVTSECGLEPDSSKL